MAEGYIKLHKSITKWEWYKDLNTKVVFIHLLLTANWKDGKYQGIDIPRGSVVTGRKKLAEDLGISEQSVRTAINHLKSTNELTIKSYSKFSVFTINNWDKYQVTNQQINQHLTSNQPATNHNRRNKEYKDIKEGYSARTRKPSTWNNLESEERKKQRDDFLDEFQKHIVGG